MKQFVIIAALYILLNGRHHAVGQDCNEATVVACLKPLKDLSYDLDNAIVPTMNETILNDHCNRYEQFARCMETVKPHCQYLEKQSYEGIDDAYDYLCETHKAEYLKHQKCFTNKDLHREGATCNKTLEDKLKTLGYYDDQPHYKRDRICQYAEDYFDCVENAVMSFCGDDAATWQRGMDERSLGPLLTSLACPNWTTTTDSWLMILVGIVVALAVVIIITSVVMLILIRRKKKQGRAARQRHGDPEMPPPYTGPVVYGAGGENVQMSNGNQAGPLPEKGPGLLPPPYSGQDHGVDNPTFTPPTYGAAVAEPTAPFPSRPPTLHRDQLDANEPQLYDNQHYKRGNGENADK